MERTCVFIENRRLVRFVVFFSYIYFLDILDVVWNEPAFLLKTEGSSSLSFFFHFFFKYVFIVWTGRNQTK